MRSFLVLCSLFGLYSQIPIVVEGLEIPNVLGLISGAILVAINAKNIQKSHLKAIFGVIAVAFVSILLSPQFLMFLPTRLVAIAQLSVSIFVGYGLYLELRKSSHRRAARIFLSFCLSILVGSFLETTTPLRGLITGFTAFFWDYDFAHQLNRDLNIAGFARPTFLTSEPSNVAIGLTVFSIAAMILSPTRRTALWTALILVVGLVVIRSPSVLVGMSMIFVVYWYAQRRHVRKYERTRRSLRTVYLLMLIGIPIASGALVLLAERINEISRGADFSATIRLFVSISVGLEIAARYPIAGVGLGGFEASRDIILDTLIQSGVPSSIAIEHWDRQLNNGIGTHLLFFGLFLLPVYLIAFFRLLDRLSAGNGTMIIFLMLCICFLSGSIYSPRFVIYYFLFSAVSHIAFRNSFLTQRNTGVGAALRNQHE